MVSTFPEEPVGSWREYPLRSKLLPGGALGLRPLPEELLELDFEEDEELLELDLLLLEELDLELELDEDFELELELELELDEDFELELEDELELDDELPPLMVGVV